MSEGSKRKGMPLPTTGRRLNVGCGKDVKKGWVNMDIAKLRGVDVVQDIEKTPWPFKAGSFDHVHCETILEHVEYIPVMQEIHRILKKGGTASIVVPHFTSRNNFIDPTHKKLFSIRTFEFFVQDSAYGRDYYFGFHYSKIASRKITFERHPVLCYNYIVEPIMNIAIPLLIFYEATFLCSLFPAEMIEITLVK